MDFPNSQFADQKIKALQYQVATYEDAAAYKSLFFILFPSLQNFAFSILKSRAQAEEVASDLMLEVWLRRDRLTEIDNLRLYLLIGVKHAAVARLKAESKSAKFSLQDLHVEYTSDYATPSESAELHELQNNIAKAVKDLPPSCQIIYKLAKEDRLKYKEIAQLLDLSIKTIDNQLAIALKKISRALHINRSKNKRF